MSKSSTAVKHPVEPKVSAQEIVHAKSMCLLFEVNRLGTRRKVATEQVLDAAKQIDPTMVRASKRILHSPELKELATLDNVMRGWIKARCLPSLFKGGVYVIPIKSVEAVDKEIEEFILARDVYVDRVCSTYEAHREEAKKQLGPLWNVRDYPPVNRVKAMFYIRKQWFRVSTPEDLKEIDEQIWKRAKDEAEAHWREVLDAADGLLMEQMKRLVDRMVERLTPDEDGKPKIFRDSLVGNLVEFLENLDPRNINDNAQLKSVAKQAASLLKNGLTADDLRDNDAARENVLTKFTQIGKTLDALVTTRPSRRFSFDDED